MLQIYIRVIYDFFIERGKYTGKYKGRYVRPVQPYNSRRRSVPEIITNRIEYICSMCSGLKLHVIPPFINVCKEIIHTILTLINFVQQKV